MFETITVDDQKCNAHPSRIMEWDGHGHTCPSCVLGYSAEVELPSLEDLIVL